MLEVKTLYKNYPLIGTLNFSEKEGFNIFLEYTSGAFKNKKLVHKKYEILKFLRDKELYYSSIEEYELASIMLKFSEQIINKSNDYK